MSPLAEKGMIAGSGGSMEPGGESRSGVAGATHLLDVEHNALAVDWTAPSNLYVGADIGVWHSPDAGANWTPLENGLPNLQSLTCKYIQPSAFCVLRCTDVGYMNFHLS